MKAGDVEPNPGPNKCVECEKTIRANIRPFECRTCGRKAHKSCTGWTRAEYEAKAREEEKSENNLWQCGRCKETISEMVTNERAEDGEEKVIPSGDTSNQTGEEEQRIGKTKKKTQEVVVMPGVIMKKNKAQAGHECCGKCEKKLTNNGALLPKCETCTRRFHAKT